MAKKLSLLFLSIIIGAALSGVNRNGYRSDYDYNSNTDAYYKLHVEEMPHSEAEQICTLEGASFLQPSSEHDLVQVHRMFKLYPDIGDYVWVKNEDLTHQSAEEASIIELEPTEELTSLDENKCEVVTRQAKMAAGWCRARLPFVCKVDRRDAQTAFDPTCGVYASGYQRAAHIGSCYKIPRKAYTWDQAYAECSSEGAHLVVINSQAEHDYLIELMGSAPDIRGVKLSYFFHAGYRARPTFDGNPAVFKTIFNQTLQEVGHIEWAPGEPNNCNNNEYCGTLIKSSATLWDNSCFDIYAFICEKEINSTS